MNQPAPSLFIACVSANRANKRIMTFLYSASRGRAVFRLDMFIPFGSEE